MICPICGSAKYTDLNYDGSLLCHKCPMPVPVVNPEYLDRKLNAATERWGKM